MNKERADTLVQRQAQVTRSKAQGLIQTGQVTLPDGTPIQKPGVRLDSETVLDIREQPRFVSRGGDKLEGAIQDLSVDVEGVCAIDVGASTGGFTDCLLQHGARHVIAVDVGYGQLAWSLRDDDRVTVLERTNIRNLQPGDLPEAPDFFTVDCSFISLSIVLPAVRKLVTPDARGLALIKPQFEAGPEHVEKGGVVRDEKVRQATIDRVLHEAEAAGFKVLSDAPCALKGPAGNQEHFAYVQAHSHA